MWAALRVLSYSFESIINKRLLNKNNVIYYLANKYWLGLPFLAIIFFLDKTILNKEGIWLLVLICFLLSLSQLLSFNGLARIKASTNVVVKQSKLLIMLFVSLILGQVTSFLTVISVIIVFIGGVLITKKEMDESINKKDTLIGILLALFVPIISIAISFLLQYAFSKNYFSAGIYSIFSIISIVILFNIIYYTNFYNQKQAKNSFNKKELGLLQLTGILSIGVNIANALSIKYIGVFLTEIISATAPILVLLFAIITKQEKLTTIRAVGVVIAVLGTILALVF